LVCPHSLFVQSQHIQQSSHMTTTTTTTTASFFLEVSSGNDDTPSLHLRGTCLVATVGGQPTATNQQSNRRIHKTRVSFSHKVGHDDKITDRQQQSSICSVPSIVHVVAGLVGNAKQDRQPWTFSTSNTVHNNNDTNTTSTTAVSSARNCGFCSLFGS
jgi:hypothetical protein